MTTTEIVFSVFACIFIGSFFAAMLSPRSPLMQRIFFKKIQASMKQTKEKTKIIAPISQHKRYYEVREQTPDEGVYVIGYSEPYGSYHICKYNPIQGWQNSENVRLSAITHWCDDPILMPFENRNEYNRFIAEMHGLTES